MKNIIHTITTYIPETQSNWWEILVALGTLALAIATFFSIRESIKARKLMIQPNILVDFCIDSGVYLQLIVKNSSNYPAHDVVVSIVPKINHPFGRIDLLSPFVEMRHTLSIITDIEKDRSSIDTEYDVIVEYRDINKGKHKIPFHINLTPLLDTFQNTQATPEEELRRDIKYLADSIRDLFLNK